MPALAIGRIALDLPAVQAALSGYSDLPMRLVARAHGAPYALHEVMLDELVLRPGKERRRLLAIPQEDHPVGGQLMGSQPETFAAAARDLVRAGYDAVDLNFGCPVSKVLGRCRGGHLLREPTRALDIVARVVDAVAADVPVTVKMRRGFDDGPESERAFFTILDGAFARGVRAITVHGRTVQQKYIGPSRTEFLRQVKAHAGDRTILGSGDLFDAFDVQRMLRTTGVDGVSVARGCIGNPFLFTQIRDLLAGRAPRAPTLREQRDALRMHWQLAAAHYGKGRAVTPVRMHAIKYAQHHPDPIAARDAMVAVRSAADLTRAIETVFDPAGDTEPRALRATPDGLDHEPALRP
jgi:nifR3 family TIM-barrel protein